MRQHQRETRESALVDALDAPTRGALATEGADAGWSGVRAVVDRLVGRSAGNS